MPQIQIDTALLQDGINEAVNQAATYTDEQIGIFTVAQVRALTGDLPKVITTTDFGGGEWYHDTVDIVSADNTGTVLVTASGGVYKRIYNDCANVTWFGALGNGIDDDTAALQVALDSGEALIFPEKKTYFITTTLLLGNNRLIEGNGSEIVHNTSTLSDVIRGFDQFDLIIQNLKINGRKDLKTTGVNSGRGFDIEGGNNITIRNCHIENTWEHGIRIGGGIGNPVRTDNIYIQDNTLLNCGNITYGRGSGIWVFWDCHYIHIEGNLCENSMASDIFVDDTSSDATPGVICTHIYITGNITKSAVNEVVGSRSIGIEGSTDFVISNNIVSGKSIGISLSAGQGAEYIGRGVVSSNTVTADRDGIYLVDVADTRVFGNVIELLAGVTTNRGAVTFNTTFGSPRPIKNVAVSGNTIITDHYGIYLRNSTDPLDSALRFKEILLEGNVITRNPASTMAGSIGIFMPYTNGLIIRNNVIDDNLVGINVSSTTESALIVGNTVRNSESYGIQIAIASTYIGNNNTSGSATAGLRAESAANSASVIVSGNNITDGISGTGFGSSGLALRYFNTGISNSTPNTVTTTIDFGSVPANAQLAAPSTVTLTGAATGDCVVIGAPNTTGIVYKGVVTSANTITLYACNFTIAAIDPGSGSFKVSIIK